MEIASARGDGSSRQGSTRQPKKAVNRLFSRDERDGAAGAAGKPKKQLHRLFSEPIEAPKADSEMKRILRIVRERLLTNPLVLGARLQPAGTRGTARRSRHPCPMEARAAMPDSELALIILPRPPAPPNPRSRRSWRRDVSRRQVQGPGAEGAVHSHHNRDVSEQYGAGRLSLQLR